MQHDFTGLYSHYPAVIALMDDTFTSHEFIRRLAQHHQREYIEALYAYRDSTHRGGNAPFRTVHGILAQRLSAYPQLVTQVRNDAPSVDIFGTDENCTEWRKV